MKGRIFKRFKGAYVVRNSKRRFFINRKVKDRLFRFIFEKDRKALLQLYNALNGTDYQDESELTIVTIQDVVYMSMKNDLAFIIAGVLNMYEHQSSFNPNLPVRFFIYLGQEFQKVIAKQNVDVYGRKLIKLPNPRCVVFYNGDSAEPDEQILKLSDAYENAEESPQVELTVRMININFGHNKELMEKCRRLWEYSYFVEQIKRGLSAGADMNEAVSRAVDYCIDRDILADILEENKMEVVGMLLTEFNERRYKRLIKKLAREEGWEEGWEEGIVEGREKGITEGREQGIVEGREQGIAEGREQGIVEGREQGIAEGREQGITEGREKGSAEVRDLFIKNMLIKGFSDQQIRELAACDQDKVDAIRTSLENKHL